MVSNNKNERVLSKSDLTKLGLRATLLQCMFNYERMQSGGWLISQLPELQKIYGDDKEGLKLAMEDKLNFMNTSPPLVGMLMGMLLSLEESKAPRETIAGLRVALFGPMAGIGDSLFWFTLLPIVAGISASFAQQGNILGPIIFFIVYFGMFLIKIPFTHLGYNTGTRAIESISKNATKIAHAATILGVTVVGALISTYVSIQLLPEFVIGEGNIVNLQTDLIDTIFPNILPLLFTLLMFYLIKNKKINSGLLILGTFIGAIVLSYFGIL